MTLQELLHEDPDLASVGPAQVDGDGVSARVVWPYPSPAGSWIEAIGLASLRRTPPDRSFVIGSVLLLRADALRRSGPSTRTSSSTRRRPTGPTVRPSWGAATPRSPRCRPCTSGATSTDPSRRETHFHASQERYLRKHFGAAGGSWHAGRARWLRRPRGRAAWHRP
ncbi:hypothetical protein NKG05_19685 [Oerskovia sp. M15]